MRKRDTLIEHIRDIMRAKSRIHSLYLKFAVKNSDTFANTGCAIPFNFACFAEVSIFRNIVAFSMY